MANISKIKRDKMIAFLEELKKRIVTTSLSARSMKLKIL